MFQLFQIICVFLVIFTKPDIQFSDWSIFFPFKVIFICMVLQHKSLSLSTKQYSLLIPSIQNIVTLNLKDHLGEDVIITEGNKWCLLLFKTFPSTH